MRALFTSSCRGVGRVAPVLLLAVTLTSCAQILRDDSGGQPAQPGSSGSPGSPSAPAYLATYYLSPSGNDAAPGTSPATAWRTLHRASQAVLRPGTRLLLQGGRRFTGELRLGPDDAGSAAHPVLVGSYGPGRATIVARKSDAISIVNTAGVIIRSLSIAGRGQAFTDDLGISAYSSGAGTARLSGLEIQNVRVSGFADGISIGSAGTAGFRNVLVSDSVLSGNLDNGLMTWGPPFDPARPRYAHENVRVQRVTAVGNRGDPRLTAHNSGSGIVLGSVANGLVSQSIAHDNGGRGGAREGPDGIWAYDSTRVRLEHCVSYHNRTNDAEDGDGFGLDQNTSHSVMQYDLSYDNDGAGYLLYSSLNNGAQTHNVVRFSISSADVQDQSPSYGGISVVGYAADSAVYQNTVVMGPQHTGTVPAIILGWKVEHITVRNNVFLVHAGAVVVAQRQRLGLGQVLLQGNDYYAVASPVTMIWGPAVYPSMASWQSSTGQEMLHGRRVGRDADPHLRGPLIGLRVTVPGTAPVIRRFTPRGTSPLVGTGLNLPALFGLNPGPGNFAGQPIRAAELDIGAL